MKPNSNYTRRGLLPLVTLALAIWATGALAQASHTDGSTESFLTQYADDFWRILIVAVLVPALWFGNRRLIAHYDPLPQLKFRRQIIQIGVVLGTILVAILVLPFNDPLHGQLLNVYGLIISATIALSSTTLVGNALAGIMLKAIGSCRPGNYITVGDHFGRISEMDLLHTEIQTEERDLTTLPNLYLVTNPVRVMRESGTVLYVELSLGYELSRHIIEELLVKAATDCELESPFVQIRDLGDYSVTYRISGLLKNVNQLLDKRRQLRGKTIDALHAEGIEIVSPTFMNTRTLSKGQSFVANVDVEADDSESRQSTDSIVFDKAEKAESVERLRERMQEVETRIVACKKLIDEEKSGEAVDAANTEIAELEKRKARYELVIERKEAQISKS